MDDKKVNNPTPTPNSSDTFKSTNIYASKASNQADYFAHVQPTLQDKIRTKTKKIQKLQQLPRHRKLAAVALGILILCIIGVGLWLLVAQPFNGHPNNSTDSEDSTPVVVRADDDIDVVNSAYQDKISSTSDHAQLAVIYLERAADFVARYVEENDSEALKLALSDAEAAEDLDPSYDSAECLSVIYQHLGDNDKANGYAQLMEQRRSPLQLNERGEPINAQ